MGDFLEMEINEVKLLGNENLLKIEVSSDLLVKSGVRV